MIDSHCHLDHEPLFGDLSNIIKRSKDVGIEKLLTISTTLESFERIKKIIKIDERKYYKNTFVQHKILDDILDKNNYLSYKDTYTFFNKKLRNTTLKSYFCLLIHSFVNISYKYKFDNLIKKIDTFIYKY